MKTPSLFVLLILLNIFFTFALKGQSSFEEGYILFDNGQRKNVGLYNFGWVDNPKRFRYREANSEEVRFGTLEDVSEFGLTDDSRRYLRQAIDIDLSSSDPGKLSTLDKPAFIRDTVFLEWLVAGEIDLFSWNDGPLKRFYFRKGQEEPVPLISRKFRDGNDIHSREYYFRGQLSRSIDCELITDSDFRKLEYRESDLIRIITAVNECLGAPSKTISRPVKGRLSLGIRSGLAFHSGQFLATEVFGNSIELPLPKALSPRIGLEVEYRLPFANNRWAIFAEAAYQRYVSDDPGDNTTRGFEVNHQTIEINFGPRRYIHLNDKLSFFGQIMGAVKFPLGNSSITYRRPPNMVPFFRSTNWNLAAGAGVGISFLNRYQFAVEYLPKQDYLQLYVDQSTSVQSLSFVLCYRFNKVNL